MTILTWVVRLLVLLLLAIFASRNTDLIILRFIGDLEWIAPLVVVLVSFFGAGLLMGALSLSGVIYRQRREISRLKRALPDTHAKSTTPPAV